MATTSSGPAGPRMHTDRLELIATTLEHLRLELATPEELGRALGAVIPKNWPPGEYDRAAMEFFSARIREHGPSAVGWYGWYAIREAEAETPRTLVASGGYFGPPGPEGVVEIGYSVLPEWRGRGYATEIVRALTHRALEDSSVKLLVAHAGATNMVSHGVLERCGFKTTGRDSEYGLVRFERGREAPAP
jgi:ribosomal-protein-alanine N-acetyltransferase